MSRSSAFLRFSELQDKLNGQINMELTAAHEYLAMYAYFAHDTQALPGLTKFFKVSANEEREHAEKLIEYMNMRGGVVKLTTIPAPTVKLGSPLDAINHTIKLENMVLGSLEALVSAADKAQDVEFSDLLTSEFIREQHSAIKKLCDMQTQLCRAGNECGMGLYIWDQDLLKSLD